MSTNENDRLWAAAIAREGENRANAQRAVGDTDGRRKWTADVWVMAELFERLTPIQREQLIGLLQSLTSTQAIGQPVMETRTWP